MADADAGQDWLRATDTSRMLWRLGELGVARRKAGRRKLRLLACALCRSVWERLTDPRIRSAVEAAERFAEGNATDAERAEAEAQGFAAMHDLQRQAREADPDSSVARAARMGSLYLAGTALTVVSGSPARDIATAVAAVVRTWGSVPDSVSSELVREVFGNPFRPVRVDPSWLAWDGGTVRKLARSVHDEQAVERLPILADALEEAGCADAQLLAHLRGPGPHFRGCWAVDLLLGRP